jgi:hypothetical protein
MESTPFNQSYEQLPPPTGLPINDGELMYLGLPEDPTLPPDNENYQNHYNNDTTIEQPLQHTDAGLIDIAPIGELIDDAKVSYHGLRFVLSKKKQLDAEDRVQKYRAPSNRIDKTASKKSRKAEEKAANARIVAKGYTGKANKLGMTKREKREARKEIGKSNMSASEKHLKRLKLDAKRTINQNVTQRVVSNKDRRANNRLERYNKKSRPISTKWRDYRHARAVSAVTRHRIRAEEHLEKARDIKY